MSIGTSLARPLFLDCLLVEAARRERLGYVIRAARQRADMTADELAARLGVVPATVYAWEQHRKAPSILMLGPLCDALGVTPELFRALPAEPPSPIEEYVVQAATEGAREGARRAARRTQR